MNSLLSTSQPQGRSKCHVHLVGPSMLMVVSALLFMPTAHTFTPTAVRLSTPHLLRSSAYTTTDQYLPTRPSVSIRYSTPTTTRRRATLADEQMDEALKNNDLEKAANLLMQNPDMELNRERWNAIFSAIEETTANADENTENLRQAAEFPLQSAARGSMTKMYNTLKRGGHLRLFGAVDTKMPPAAGSHVLPPALLESILDIPMKALTPKPTNTLLIAGVVVALIEALISATFGISLNLLTFGTLLSFVADRLFLNGALSETALKLFQPGIQSKILRHESGHLLCAYLLGCPVEGIVLSAWAALQDQRFGSRQVSAGTSFFDPDLSQQINSNGKLTRSALDRYSIIVMAGIAAEADLFGEADGGAGDEMALVAFLSRLNGGRAGAWNSETIRNQARWGALNAVLMIREYKPAYDALVDALERGGTLGDCIYAIEKAARDHNLKPLQEPIGYIDNGKWTKEMPSSLKSAEAVAVTASATKSTSTATEFDQDASLSRLNQYRAEVEKKLQDVERELKELDGGEQ